MKPASTLAQRKPKTKFIGAKIPVAHADALERIAKREDLTVSQIFRRLIRDGLESVKSETN